MVTHLVLFAPRPNLPPAERRALVGAFQQALREIPTVRSARVGRRVLHGAGYEAPSVGTPAYLVMIEFDDLAGLRAYLRHPAHEELGVLFGGSLPAASVYDFEEIPLDRIGEVV